MATLHIVNKSPFESQTLLSCLRLIKRRSGILLTEDGVYAATTKSPMSEQIAESMVVNSIYVLEPDARARGLWASSLLSEITRVDYSGYVQLCIEYDRTISWL